MLSYRLGESAVDFAIGRLRVGKKVRVQGKLQSQQDMTSSPRSDVIDFIVHSLEFLGDERGSAVSLESAAAKEYGRRGSKKDTRIFRGREDERDTGPFLSQMEETLVCVVDRPEKV